MKRCVVLFPILLLLVSLNGVCRDPVCQTSNQGSAPIFGSETGNGETQNNDDHDYFTVGSC